MRRFNVLVMHRRFGKTVMCINDLIDQAVRCTKDRPRYAYISPLYRQSKQVAWDYLKHYTRNFPDISTNEAELRVDFGEARIQLFGADNPDSLRGIYLDGVVLDEYAQMPGKLWTEVIRPSLTDREGTATFIGTPKGRNAFWDLYDESLRGVRGPDWYADLKRASETKILPDSELRGARQDMTEDEYEQEFECSFTAAIGGAYYGKIINQAEKEGRIARVPYDPAVKVDTAWDLGIGDSTSIWFIQVGQEIHWIDFYESNGVGLEHYVRVLQTKPYIYGDHILPHDAEAKELGSGKSRTETLKGMGVQNVRVLPIHAVDDGINEVRLKLARSWFDAEKCRDGLEALRQYRREWDEKGETFRPRPYHDWASHAADAARYACMGLRGPNRGFRSGEPIKYPQNHPSRGIV
jgi:phage terminase large subunit